MPPNSLLISTSGYNYYHPLYSRTAALIDYLCDSNQPTVKADVLLTRRSEISQKVRNRQGSVDWFEISIPRVVGVQRQVEMAYHWYAGLRTVLRKGLRYDVCLAMDLDGWGLGYLLKKLGLVGRLVYNDQDHYPTFLSEHKFQAFATDIMERTAIRHSDLVVTVSRKLAHFRKSQGCKRLEIVPNGVDVRLFSQVKTRRRAPGAVKRFVFAGYLGRGWGLETLIQAFHATMDKCPMSLMIIGDGPSRPSLEAQVRQLELGDKVHFTGKVLHETLPRYFAEADFGVAPYEPASPADFNSSLKVREYMAAGLPVIVTKVGDLQDLVVASKAGVMTDCSVKGLSEALLQMCSCSEEAYSLMSKSAVGYMSANYDWPVLLRGLLRLIAV